ncbi:MAG: hypothetical protein Q9168_006296, partial [Polycauliona sp. 1 TL-2023]
MKGNEATAPPEVKTGGLCAYSFQGDVYAVGMTMDMMCKITTQAGRAGFPLGSCYSHVLGTAISMLTQFDPYQRPQMDEFARRMLGWRAQALSTQSQQPQYRAGPPYQDFMQGQHPYHGGRCSYKPKIAKDVADRKSSWMLLTRWIQRVKRRSGDGIANSAANEHLTVSENHRQASSSPPQKPETIESAQAYAKDIVARLRLTTRPSDHATCDALIASTSDKPPWLTESCLPTNRPSLALLPSYLQDLPYKQACRLPEELPPIPFFSILDAAMLIEGEKYACDACVRGHRVSNCQHS